MPGDRRAVTSAAVAAALLALPSVAGCTTSAPAASSTATVATTSPGRATGASDVEPESWASERRRGVESLARRLATAMSRGDGGALAALAAGGSRSELGRRQRAVAARMAAMGAGDVTVVAVRERSAPVPVDGAVPVDWDVRVTLTYRLRGFDTAPRTFDLDLTVRAAPEHASTPTVVESRPAERPQPWDLADLVVRRSPDVLVLAVGSRARVDEVVRRARAARGRVAAVWGSVRPAVWVAPASDTDAARLLGRDPADLAGVAAATDGPLVAGHVAGADRIVVVPGPWDSLRPAGRDVVLTHELTHAAVRASTTRAVPLWLSEGFAELGGSRAVDLPERSEVAPVVTAARRSGVPRSLPGADAFDPSRGALPVAYGQSLLALRTLRDRHGTAAVVRFYRAAAGGLTVPTSQGADPEAVVDAALGDVLHTDRRTLVRAWQARIRGLL